MRHKAGGVFIAVIFLVHLTVGPLGSLFPFPGIGRIFQLQAADNRSEAVNKPFSLKARDYSSLLPRDFNRLLSGMQAPGEPPESLPGGSKHFFALARQGYPHMFRTSGGSGAGPFFSGSLDALERRRCVILQI